MRRQLRRWASAEAARRHGDLVAELNARVFLPAGRSPAQPFAALAADTLRIGEQEHTLRAERRSWTPAMAAEAG